MDAAAHATGGFPPSLVTPLLGTLITVGSTLGGLWIRVLFVSQPTRWTVKLAKGLSGITSFYAFVVGWCVLFQLNKGSIPGWQYLIMIVICLGGASLATNSLVEVMEKHVKEAEANPEAE